MKYVLLIAPIFVAVLPNLSIAQTERWNCQIQISAKPLNQEWIISEGKMTGAGEKAGMLLIYDNKQIAIAYSLSQGKGLPATSFLFVLDKTAGKMISYNDLQAAVTAGAYGRSEAGIAISPCTRAH